MVRFIGDKQRTVYCPESGVRICFRFEWRGFTEAYAHLLCPACGRDHAAWARFLAESAEAAGWRATIELAKPEVPDPPAKAN